MYSIKENSSDFLEINKSKFYTFLYRVNTYQEVNLYLEEVRKLYKDATHYCFAYKIGNIQKFSDDGEPSGTAGLPIMDVIQKRNLDYVLCIVVRYFGGIKLGAGGLVRAYSNACKQGFDKCQIIELVDGYEIRLEANYETQKQIDYVFENCIKKKEFQEKVIYYLDIEKEKLELLHGYSYQIIQEKKIEKP